MSENYLRFLRKYTEKRLGGIKNCCKKSLFADLCIWNALVPKLELVRVLGTCIAVAWIVIHVCSVAMVLLAVTQ